MSSASFDRAVLRRPPASPAAPRAMSANVTRSDSSGVWVTPQGGDQNHPSGPCRGALRLSPFQPGQTTPQAYERLPIGTRVLYVVADDGPWILNWEV